MYRIEEISDLMVVMGRGRFAAGDAAKLVFLDGRTHEQVGEVPTRYAPHLMDFHPRDPRWAYVRDDMGYVHKIDLYSLKTVRTVRAGLNGASLAVSRDGRYLAAGSYVPHTLVILDARTLEPVKLLPLRGTHAPHEWQRQQRQQRQGKPRLVQRCNTHALSAAGVWCL